MPTPANPATARLIHALRHQLVPAALTPMDKHATVDLDATERYATTLAESGSGGIAVWAHTGRGRHLSAGDRGQVLRTFRQATSLPIIAGAGVPVFTTGDPATETIRMAVHAAELGADAVLVFPPAELRDGPSRESQLLMLHERVALECDLPVIGFYLHHEAGGYDYSASLIHDLLDQPNLAGIKVATLDRSIACQDTLSLIANNSDRLAITGEDRMFGPSLMWGADSALVGIAAARVSLSLATLRAWFEGDLGNFHSSSTRLDRFATNTFHAPIEGYVQRMHSEAAREGIIPPRAAIDPYGPESIT